MSLKRAVSQSSSHSFGGGNVRVFGSRTGVGIFRATLDTVSLFRHTFGLVGCLTGFEKARQLLGPR